MKLVSFLLCAFFALPIPGVYAAELVSLTSNKSSYAVGESAILRTQFSVRAQGPDLEYFVSGNVNGEPVSFSAVAEDDFFAVSSPFSVSGTYLVQAQGFIQDKRQASEISGSITFFENRNLEITELLETETDPELLASLVAERDRNEFLIERLSAELNSLRKPVGSAKEISVLVN